MKQLLIIDLREEINEYVGDLPEESWGYDSDTAEYGAPDELAMSAAIGFFGYIGSDDPNHDEEEDFNEMDRSIGYSCSIEPNDQFWFDVHHNLNNFKDTLIEQGLTHATDISFSAGRLIIEVSTEMDMAKHHDRLQPPRS
jgi:hypothetical protein